MAAQSVPGRGATDVERQDALKALEKLNKHLGKPMRARKRHLGGERAPASEDLDVLSGTGTSECSHCPSSSSFGEPTECSSEGRWGWKRAAREQYDQLGDKPLGSASKRRRYSVPGVSCGVGGGPALELEVWSSQFAEDSPQAAPNKEPATEDVEEAEPLAVKIVMQNLRAQPRLDYPSHAPAPPSPMMAPGKTAFDQLEQLNAEIRELRTRKALASRDAIPTFAKHIVEDYIPSLGADIVGRSLANGYKASQHLECQEACRKALLYAAHDAMWALSRKGQLEQVDLVTRSFLQQIAGLVRQARDNELATCRKLIDVLEERKVLDGRVANRLRRLWDPKRRVKAPLDSDCEEESAGHPWQRKLGRTPRHPPRLPYVPPTPWRLAYVPKTPARRIPLTPATPPMLAGTPVPRTPLMPPMFTGTPLEGSSRPPAMPTSGVAEGLARARGTPLLALPSPGGGADGSAGVLIGATVTPTQPGSGVAPFPMALPSGALSSSCGALTTPQRAPGQSPGSPALWHTMQPLPFMPLRAQSEPPAPGQVPDAPDLEPLLQTPFTPSRSLGRAQSEPPALRLPGTPLLPPRLPGTPLLPPLPQSISRSGGPAPGAGSEPPEPLRLPGTPDLPPL